MTEKFVASNGVSVEYRTHFSGLSRLVFNEREGDQMTPQELDALIEYMDYTRDKDLGRWRHPTDRDWVAYTVTDDDVWLVNERAGYEQRFNRHDLPRMIKTEGVSVAIDYFAANTELKPWHEAGHLTIWALNIVGVLSDTEAYICRDGVFRPVNNESRVSFPTTDLRIGSARCIWPEAS